ncbi:MAG: hypothetical protein IPM01_28490, partial [Burkholderiaceae bacterium]|nr:hypothetical protein [Burkholderiaceae bacterium]
WLTACLVTTTPISSLVVAAVTSCKVVALAIPLTAGAGSDRLVYAGASETGHILGTVLTSAAQVDQINQFDDAFGGLPAPATDYLVLDGIGSVNFPLVNTVVQSSANYGATVDIAAGAVVLAGDPDAIAPASMYDMNLVVTNMKAALILGPALPVGAEPSGCNP